MAIEIHGPAAVKAMRRAGRAAGNTLAEVGALLKPGVSTADIDRWVRRSTLASGGRPSQLGYHGFPAAVCVSRNEVICHGIPSDAVILQSGDIVNVDVTTELCGYHGDTSRTFALGSVDERKAKVRDVALACLQAAIAATGPGMRLGELGTLIESRAASHGCGVVREFGGHGIGRRMHMPPHVNHFDSPQRGPRLRPGMIFTIEPMITLGTPNIVVLPDAWTVITADGSPSAQFEHTVLVTKEGAEILTLPGPPLG